MVTAVCWTDSGVVSWGGLSIHHQGQVLLLMWLSTCLLFKYMPAPPTIKSISQSRTAYPMEDTRSHVEDLPPRKPSTSSIPSIGILQIGPDLVLSCVRI